MGDLHLWSLLRVHGLVMSGGVGFAADMASFEEVAAAVAACQYFDLPSLANLMQRLRGLVPDEDDDAQAAYDALVPTDQVLSDAFELRFAKHPADFDPI